MEHSSIVDIVCMNLAGLTDFSSDASAAALDVSNFFWFLSRWVIVLSLSDIAQAHSAFFIASHAVLV